MPWKLLSTLAWVTMRMTVPTLHNCIPSEQITGLSCFQSVSPELEVWMNRQARMCVC